MASVSNKDVGSDLAIPAEQATSSTDVTSADSGNDSSIVNYRNERGHISGFTLKILAIIGMTFNHASHVLSSFMPWEVMITIYWLGGITFPIMAFLLVEGFLHTSNVSKYALRLLAFAVIAQVPYTLCFGWTANVLFTLLIGLLMLWAWSKIQNRFLGILVVIAATALSYLCDWAIAGPVIIFLFYVLRPLGVKGIFITMAFAYLYTCIPSLIDLPTNLSIGISEGARVSFSNVLSMNYRLAYIAGIPISFHSGLLNAVGHFGYALIGYTLALICLLQYNGKRGRPMKWFFYAYYPLHLFVLWGAAKLLDAV